MIRCLHNLALVGSFVSLAVQHLWEQAFALWDFTVLLAQLYLSQQKKEHPLRFLDWRLQRCVHQAITLLLSKILAVSPVHQGLLVMSMVPPKYKYADLVDSEAYKNLTV